MANATPENAVQEARKYLINRLIEDLNVYEGYAQAVVFEFSDEEILEAIKQDLDMFYHAEIVGDTSSTGPRRRIQEEFERKGLVFSPGHESAIVSELKDYIRVESGEEVPELPENRSQWEQFVIERRNQWQSKQPTTTDIEDVPLADVIDPSQSEDEDIKDTAASDQIEELKRRYQSEDLLPAEKQAILDQLQSMATNIAGELDRDVVIAASAAFDELNKTEQTTYEPFYADTFEEQIEKRARLPQIPGISPEQWQAASLNRREWAEATAAATAREKYEQLYNDLQQSMQLGGTVGQDLFGETANTEEVLMGYPSSDSSRWVPGFIQQDFRLGDVRNQKGLIPGLSRDAPSGVNRVLRGRNLGVEMAWLLEDMSPRDINTLWMDMEINDPSTFRKFQRAFMDAGYYDSTETMPVWGSYRGAEQTILLMLRDKVMESGGNRSLMEIINADSQTRLQNLGQVTGVLSSEQAKDRIGTLTSSEALRQLADELGETGAGRRPTEDAVNRAIESVHAAERSYWNQYYSGSDVNSGLGLEGNPERSRMIEAMGGVGSFSAKNWSDIAVKAFGDQARHMPQTPKNAELAAHILLQHYYDSTGSWAEAVGWLMSGPERHAFIDLQWDMGKRLYGVNQETGMPNRMPSEYELVDFVLARYATMNEGQLAEMAEGARSGVMFIEQPDANAILKRELRAADEVGYQSWEFADTALQFYNMLGSAV